MSNIILYNSILVTLCRYVVVDVVSIVCLCENVCRFVYQVVCMCLNSLSSRVCLYIWADILVCQVSIFRVHLCIDLCIMLMFESVYIHLYIYIRIYLSIQLYMCCLRVCAFVCMYTMVFLIEPKLIQVCRIVRWHILLLLFELYV